MSRDPKPRAFASGGLTAHGWPRRLESIKKAEGPIWPTARGVVGGAVLPPDNYLEEGADLPRSAAPTGAIVGTKRNILFIFGRPPYKVVWRGTRVGRGV